jgi:hypothetical protein
MTRISFGILALNAQPFLEYNLRALYPVAHEIIVVEGSVRAAASLATPNGHSTDDTLLMLAEFKNKNDTENKLRVISATEEGYADGFWPEKDEMSRAYAKYISGDWLWQVDSDEFYREDDMRAVVSLMEGDPSISLISFPYLEFFGSFDSLITGSWHLYEQTLCHRVFRWGPGYHYASHRPPTVVDESGTDLSNKRWIRAPKNGSDDITLFHYSYVLPKQAHQKVGYYSNVEWTSSFRDNERWFAESYMLLKRPLFLGEKGWPNLQWLEGYKGKHPEAIEALRKDLKAGKIREILRPTKDISQLLSSSFYSLQRITARLLLAIYWPLRTAWKAIRRGLLGIRNG